MSEPDQNAKAQHDPKKKQVQHSQQGSTPLAPRHQAGDMERPVPSQAEGEEETVDQDLENK